MHCDKSFINKGTTDAYGQMLFFFKILRPGHILFENLLKKNLLAAFINHLNFIISFFRFEKAGLEKTKTITFRMITSRNVVLVSGKGYPKQLHQFRKSR